MLDARVSGIDAARADDAPAQLLATPAFSTPLDTRLAALSVEHLVPGADAIADNTVGLLTANQVFVEAFLAGANHELGREFRWREYPTPLDQTWLRRFWDNVDDSDDIRPIAKWRADKGLGANAPANATPAELVLLVTGPLLRRYPDTRVYAVAARWDGDRRVEDKNGEVRLPVFTGTLGRGRTFYGFALTKKEARGSTDPNQAPGWFFVFEEQPGALRFGLNAPAGPPPSEPPALTSWNTLSWYDVSPLSGPLATFVDTSGPDWLVTAGPLPGNAGPPADVDAWGENSAAMARITVQRPVRVLIHADSMLAKEPT
jgi:hypothetical protein